MPEVHAKEVDKLGHRLRRGTPTRQDLARLQEFRAAHFDALASAQSILRELGIQATSRIKTETTIIEKLRREGTRLSTMQDIAGLRIVRDITLTEQDELVDQLVRVFRETRMVDRRVTPRFGYRAVHVIATIDGYHVEIQVRTAAQDVFAETVEKMADQYGRGIRYGEYPHFTDTDGSAVEGPTPITLLLDGSKLLADSEMALDKVARQLNEMRAVSVVATDLPPDKKEELRIFIEKGEEQAARARAIHATAMGLLRELVDIVES